ncbi:MAG: cyclic nucleotide-binding domain-containing protein [Deltaproteobacteria bacterium]|nr:cyclic nucleotide-binding domain-containing protein [Deltaproteobacteria bacterium]
MPLVLSAHGLVDLGRKRKVNEDTIAVDEERGVYVVADGMGGHGNGAAASQLAVTAVREYLHANTATLDRFRDAPDESTRVAAIGVVERAIQSACQRIFQVGQQDASKRGMGTTVDVLVRVGDRAILGHVGDGRVHLLRAGQSYRLTKDHTIVAQQVEAGIITPKDAEESTLRGVLTRALGTHQSVQVDTLLFDLAEGDRILMSSDGLHRYLRDPDVPARVREASAAGVKQLIDFANAGGGEDNISVILIGCASSAGAQEVDPRRVTSRVDAVRSLPLFHHLTYKEQVAVLSIAQSRVYEPGTVIVRQGDPGQEIFIIVDGQVGVERDGVQIAELVSGGHFGEMSLVDDAPRSASVRALTRTDVLAIGQSEMGGLMRLDPVLAVKILWTLVQALSARLRHASAGLVDLEVQASARPSAVPAPFLPPR